MHNIVFIYKRTLVYEGNFEIFSSHIEIKSIMYYKNDLLKFSNICYRLYLDYYLHHKS